MFDNKKLFYILIFFFLLAPTTLIYAQTPGETIRDYNVTKAAERREDKQTQREEFKARLQALQDERKQEIIERIDKNITTLNEKHTNRFKKLLEKLSSILDRIENRASDIEEDGADITNVTSEITNARNTITESIEMIDAQSEKDYVIELVDDETLGQTVSAAFKEFKDDMAALRESVRASRDAVKEAASALQTVIKEFNSENGS